MPEYYVDVTEACFLHRAIPVTADSREEAIDMITNKFGELATQDTVYDSDTTDWYINSIEEA